MIRGISPVLWNSLHQLHAEGSPIDMDDLYRRVAPLHLENKLPFVAQPVVRWKQGFLLVLRLGLYARSPIAVQRLEMGGHWLPGPVECFRACPRHHGGLCAQSGTVHFRQTDVGPHLLNFGVLPRYIEAGREVDGLLIGYCPTKPPTVETHDHLDVTVSVHDVDGYTFRFSLLLQPGTEPSDNTAITKLPMQ